MTTAVLWTLVRFYRAGLGWWSGGVALGLLLIELAALRWGEPDHSIWVYAGTLVQWGMLVLGLLAVPGLFRVLVAHGATRRSIAAGGAIAIGLLAAATGGYMAAGFLVERALYATASAPTGLPDPHLFDSTGQLHLVFTEYALLAAGYLVTGWLVGAGYVRFGWLGGTLALPVAVLPMSAVEYLLGTVQSSGWGVSRLDLATLALPLGVAVALAAVAVGLGLLAGRWLLHPVPVKAKTS